MFSRILLPHTNTHTKKRLKNPRHKDFVPVNKIDTDTHLGFKNLYNIDLEYLSILPDTPYISHQGLDGGNYSLL